MDQKDSQDHAVSGKVPIAGPVTRQDTGPDTGNDFGSDISQNAGQNAGHNTGDNAGPEAEGPSPVPAYVLDDQVGFLMRLAGQRHTGIFQELVPLGLTPTQFSALVRLAQMGACSQNELGRRTAMDVATIKGVVDRLRRKGLVDVAADPGDRRRTILSIAPAHAHLARRLYEAGLVISQETLKPLTKDEQAQFLSLLRKLT